MKKRKQREPLHFTVTVRLGFKVDPLEFSQDAEDGREAVLYLIEQDVNDILEEQLENASGWRGVFVDDAVPDIEVERVRFHRRDWLRTMRESEDYE